MIERINESGTWYRCGATGDYAFAIDSDEDSAYQEALPFDEEEYWQADPDGSQEHLNGAYQRFRAFLDQGHPL